MNKSVEEALSKEYNLPKANSISNIVQSFSPFERLLFLILSVIFVGSGLFLAAQVNNEALVTVPTKGGEFTEGIVGSPRFINPLLAESNADQDLSALIYSGLMRATPDGSLEYDLARSHSVSEDGLVYTFILKDNVTFHDGETLGVDDILFTINRVQDATLKSPRRASWQGVIAEPGEANEIVFTLDRPYSPFLENLTLGILPQHIWEGAISEEFTFSQYNVEPIGSGPYQIDTIKRDSSGIPEYYELASFKNYAGGEPLISFIRFRFYSNENFLIDGYINGEVDSINSVSTNNLAYAELNREDVVIEQVPLPRIFGVFFNQNQATIFAQAEVREALDVAIDKEQIVEEVLEGYGTVIDSPIPPGILPEITSTTTEETVDESVSRTKQAIDILEDAGWKVNEESGVWEKKIGKDGLERLEFTISTSNAPELKAAAELIQQAWEAVGAKVTLRIFETGDLNQEVIRPRQYDALLFGEIIGRELDLFAFWHSSQRNDPGLNIALYANITADAVLEDAREISDREERIQKFIEFEQEIRIDRPAIFIYAPDFIYVLPNDVQGIDLGSVTVPSERFLGVHEWYVQTDSIWNFFVQN